MKSKRLITLLILGAMLAGTMSCGDEKTSTDTTTASSDDTTAVVEEKGDGLPEKDMDGFEFSINHFNSSWLSWANVDLESEAEDGDLVNDEIYRRNRRIEERFGCTINVNGSDMINASTIQAEVMAGDSNYDVWFSYDLWTLGAAEYLMDWNELPYVDLDKEWWNPSATEVFNIGGKQYAASGNFSLSVLSRAAGYTFNKDIYNQLNSDIDIYQLASDGKWTIDKMAALAKQAYADLNGDTVMTSDDDRFGITGSWKEFCNRAILGSGISYISKDDDGFPVFDLPNNEAAVEKLIKIYNTFMQPEVYDGQIGGNVDDVGGKGDFKSNGVLFIVDHLLGLEDKRQLDIDVGFVPCPKYDEEQYRYYAPSFGAEISVLLKTLPEERMENVGIILEALSYDSQQNLIPTYKEVVLKGKAARDDESAEMVDIIINSISFDFGINAWQNTVANPLVEKTFAAGNANFASTFASMESTVKAEIEKLHTSLDK